VGVREDFYTTAWQLPDEHQWQATSASRLERVVLDQQGAEPAISTTLLRLMPGSQYTAHALSLGEEMVVLEGELADTQQRYHAGTYLRQPPGLQQPLSSDSGCVLFVKTGQFLPGDMGQCAQPIKIEIPARGWVVDTYHDYRRGQASELVQVIRAAAGEHVTLAADYHARELLVLQGQVVWQWNATLELAPRSWVRLQPGNPLRVDTQTPCVLYTKTRPLAPW